MSDYKSEYEYKRPAQKPKELNLSEIIQQSRAEDSSGAEESNLRDLLVQRKMVSHGLTEEQALAEILAFGGS